jgi:hypothetical protein
MMEVIGSQRPSTFYFRFFDAAIFTPTAKNEWAKHFTPVSNSSSVIAKWPRGCGNS